MYEIKLLENIYGDPYEVITRTDDNGVQWSIPADEANADYCAYLAWKAEQPTPKAGK